MPSYFLSIPLSFFLILWVVSSGEAQDCEVLLEALSGSYEGDCRRGEAHGEGTARGEDTYSGEFRRGLPHGTGTYTWANGDVYVGEFNKGAKDGEGVLTLADGTVRRGFWDEDEYIGENETPYAVVQKSRTVNRVDFRRVADAPNQLEVSFTYLGKPTSVRDFSIDGSFGVVTAQTDYKQTVEVYEFPMRGNLRFSVQTTRDASSGAIGGDLVNGELEFQIFQAGTWQITLEMQAR